MNKEKKIAHYSAQHSSTPPSYLKDLLRETHLKTLAPQMASGHLQGRWLSMIVKMIKAKSILEIGTFTGYATLCMWEGLPKDGILHTIEVNPERESLIRKYLKIAGAEEQVHLHLGDAKKIIPTLDASFDLVFIDAGKMHYPQYYHMVFDKVKVGGFILADNVLWAGKVIDPQSNRDAQILDYYNKMIQKDTRVNNLLLPIRDGIMMAQKIKV